jgi:hypothetical protein
MRWPAILTPPSLVYYGLDLPTTEHRTLAGRRAVLHVIIFQTWAPPEYGSVVRTYHGYHPALSPELASAPAKWYDTSAAHGASPSATVTWRTSPAMALVLHCIRVHDSGPVSAVP